MQSASKVRRLMAAAGIVLAGTVAGAPAMAQNRNCVDTLAGLPEAARFAGVLSRTHVAEDLRQVGPFTIFAPTDAALSRVSGIVVDRLFPMQSGSREMDVVLAPAAANAHIIEGRYTSDSLPAGQQRGGRTRAGNPISFVNQGGKVTVTGPGGATATVVRADIPCSNGVIHLVDHVLVQ